MKITVFGAAGGIGKHVVRHALEQGYEVNAYVRDQKKITIVHKNLHICVGDINDYENIKKVINGCDAII